jgi:hypothetical protein
MKIQLGGGLGVVLSGGRAELGQGSWTGSTSATDRATEA